MKKKQIFGNMRLSREGIRELDQYLIGSGGIFAQPHSSVFALIEPNGAEWTFDDSEAFLADYHPLLGSCYERSRDNIQVTVIHYMNEPDLKVEVTGPDKKTIQNVFAIVEKHAEITSAPISAPQGWQTPAANA